LTDEIPPPPEGFVQTPHRGPFSIHNGPYFHRPGGEEVVQQAFYALPRHANGMGLVHGGMLSAFMDGVLAHAAGRGSGKAAVTIHMSIDYLHMARLGDWVVGEGRRTRAARDIAFVEGRAHVRGVDVVRASAIFKLLERRA